MNLSNTLGESEHDFARSALIAREKSNFLKKDIILKQYALLPLFGFNPAAKLN